MTHMLDGKMTVITGASRGIGLGVAKGFAAAGARLLLIADDDNVVARAREIGASGIVADITDGEAVAAALAPLSHIDILINNAGLERLTPLAEERPGCRGNFPPHYRNQCHRDADRDPPGSSENGERRDHHQHGLDLGACGRA